MSFESFKENLKHEIEVKLLAKIADKLHDRVNNEVLQQNDGLFDSKASILKWLKTCIDEKPAEQWYTVDRYKQAFGADCIMCTYSPTKGSKVGRLCSKKVFNPATEQLIEVRCQKHETMKGKKLPGIECLQSRYQEFTVAQTCSTKGVFSVNLKNIDKYNKSKLAEIIKSYNIILEGNEKHADMVQIIREYNQN